MNPSIACIALGLSLLSPRPSDTGHSIEVANTRGGSAVDELIRQLPAGQARRRRDDLSQKERDAVDGLKAWIDGGGELTDRQWVQALDRSGLILHRERWPAGFEFAISMRKPIWLGGRIRVEATLRRGAAKSAATGFLTSTVCGTFAMQQLRAERYQRLGVLPPGRHELPFCVEVLRGRTVEEWRQGVRAPVCLWSGMIESSVEVVERLDDVVRPISDPAIDEAVGRAISVAHVPKLDQYRVVLDPDPATHPDLARTALDLRIELLRDGRQVDEIRLTASDYDLLATASSRTEVGRQLIGFRRITSISAKLLESTPAEMRHWSLRVSGTDEHVLALWWADRYWAGTVEVPLAEARRREIEGGGSRPWIHMPSWK